MIARRSRGALYVCATAFLVTAARADTPPNVWDIAKDPSLRDSYALHVQVRRALSAEGAAARAGLLEHARALLEEAHAEASADVRLRFDLGEVYEQLGRHARAAEVLRAAVDAAPEHPAAPDALYALAIAYARLDRSSDERSMYHRYLAVISDDRLRDNALLNLAEAEMRGGDLEQACADYREAVSLATALPNGAGASQTAILAIWGLAVALDRSGDPAGAAHEARLGVSMDPDDRLIGDTQSGTIFFVPEYERYWYLGLGAIERARQATDARSAATLWNQAESLWASYVGSAAPADRWLPLARAHLSHVHAERIRAENRTAKGLAPVK